MILSQMTHFLSLVAQQMMIHEPSASNFYHLLYDPKTAFMCIFRQFGEEVLEKNPLLHTPISAQKGMFVPPMVLFLAKHTKNKVFSIKKSQFVTKMRLPKKLQFLVPRTPHTSPYPHRHPQGSGGPKMAKMHSLESNNDC